MSISKPSSLSNQVESSTASSSTSKFGLYCTMAIGGIAVAFSVITVPFILPAVRKHTLPYVPATDKQIANVFKAIEKYGKQVSMLDKYVPSASTATAATSKHHRSIKLMDLGSGDGRIVFEAAKRHYNSTGVELNTILYAYSKWKSIGFKSTHRPVFKRADFWNVSMREYDLIIVFGVQEIMKDLAKKLNDEMKPDALIVSCRYPIASYKYVYNLEDSLDSVWIYKKDSLSKLIQESIKKNSSNENDDDDD